MPALFSACVHCFATTPKLAGIPHFTSYCARRNYCLIFWEIDAFFREKRRFIDVFHGKNASISKKSNIFPVPKRRAQYTVCRCVLRYSIVRVSSELEILIDFLEIDAFFS